MGIFAYLKSHYNFLSLSILIFFSASCQFSSVTLKAGILEVGNYNSHFGSTLRCPQNLETSSASNIKNNKN